MKPLSETLTELGIAFSFPIEINDAKGNDTYYEDSRGWMRYELDANGNETYFEDSDGRKEGTPRSTKLTKTEINKLTCEGKVVEVDGIKYTLKATMKPLSETLTKLGIAFTFPIVIKDANGNRTYEEESNGYGRRWERDYTGSFTYYEDSYGWQKWGRDANGNWTYYEDNNGSKTGTPRSVKTCEGKVVEVDGIKYTLKAL